MDKNKCPKIEKPKYFPQKATHCDHNQLQLSDLEKVGELGYIEGISNIIIKNLKALDITERPVHCTDKKRETMYIKDEDKWKKEDDNKRR
jgi:hypothetical protein